MVGFESLVSVARALPTVPEPLLYKFGPVLVIAYNKDPNWEAFSKTNRSAVSRFSDDSVNSNVYMCYDNDRPGVVGNPRRLFCALGSSNRNLQ